MRAVPEANAGGPTIVGRYILEGEVASGGMATIYFGRRGDEPLPGTTVAIKRVHPHLARDRKFSSMFIDEARLLSRIRHPNVIKTVDIIASEDECLLVMEYLHGESLGRLLRLAEDRDAPPELPILSSILCGALDGLQAAHDATNAAGSPLQIVHRDISPQNIMVGADGIARVLDFGVAKAAGSLHVTRDGEIKGKLAYMSPEQLGAQAIDRRTDVYAAGVILWEAVTGRPLFDGDSEAAIIAAVLRQEIPVPSTVAAGIPPGLDAVIMRSLAHRADDRFGSAREMALALESVVPRADIRAVAAWVDSLAGHELRERQAIIRRGGGPAPVGVSPTGVTEVFFTSSSGPVREGTGISRTSADAGALIEKRMATLDASLRDVTRYLPLKVRTPASRFRWWIVGASGVIVIGLGYCAFAPSPPPATGISAAPDGFGR
jgi:serine/threonine-protein kinase